MSKICCSFQIPEDSIKNNKLYLKKIDAKAQREIFLVAGRACYLERSRYIQIDESKIPLCALASLFIRESSGI